MQIQQERVLCNVADRLSQQDIIWALGGCSLLCQSGIIDTCEDIDLILSPKDISKADAILSSMGEKYPRLLNPNYASQFYHKYKIQEVTFNIISGMTLHFKGFLYRYPFDRSAIVTMQPIQNVYIPCTSLEDWWVLYQMIPTRQKQFSALDKFMSSHGIQYPARLSKLRQQPLPPVVLAGIMRLTSLAPRTRQHALAAT